MRPTAFAQFHPGTAEEAHGPYDDVLIVGGGMAGSLLALVLARSGVTVSLVDPRRHPGPLFRNEKLGIGQIEHLSRLGVLSCFETACWGQEGASAAPASRPPLKDCGARYDRWIEGVRAAWPAGVRFVEGKADRLETSASRQAVVLTDGRRLCGRLIVVATGRGERLLAGLGVQRRVLSADHSLCLGFSVRPANGDPWSVTAEVFRGRRHALAYATIFPMEGELRVNAFSYRGLDDPWTTAMRTDPIATLAATLEGMRSVLSGASVIRKPEVRSTDLYQAHGHLQSGVVLLGDAFHAPCPASGSGFTRIINDVDRLANVHIPAWLASAGMDRDKIAAFYDDPVKREVDRASLRSSHHGRAMVVSPSPYWRARRTLGEIRRAIAA